jgi:hypothetical protein
MTTTLSQASPALAQKYSLTQAEYHALVHGFEIAMKFNPQSVVLQDSKLITFTENRRAVIQADYTPLIKQPITMVFAADTAAIKKAKTIRGAGDVRVYLQDGQYHILGDHTGARLKSMPIPDAACFTMPAISWFGTNLSEYDSKNLSEYLGKKSKAVQLAVYDDQLEQAWVEGQSYPYTFTPKMAERLKSRSPSFVLESQVAFRFIGPKQSLRLGKQGDQYFLCATTPIDMSVNLVVTELLDVVPSC